MARIHGDSSREEGTTQRKNSKNLQRWPLEHQAVQAQGESPDDQAENNFRAQISVFPGLDST